MEGAQTTRFERVLPGFLAGTVVGFTQVIVALSLASLVFSGPLEIYLARGIAAVLVTVAVHVVITSIFTSFSEALSSIQSNSAVILSVSITALVSSNLLSGVELFATVIALIMAMTLLTGIFLVALGSFRLGGLVRYIPYPVIGGFLAGTGWLLAQGAIGTMADFPLGLDTLGSLLTVDQLILWLPGVVFGLILFVGTRRIKHWLTLPGMMLCGVLVLYVVLWISGISLDQAMARGLLLGDMGGAAVWQPLPMAELAQANWEVVLTQGGNIATLLIITAMSVLLNVSGLELALHKDVDLNRELRATGFANIVSALAGGTVGYHAISFTVLSQRMGARGRIPAFVVGGLCLVLLFFGAALLAYIPRPLLGGLLLYLGLDFLYEWVVQGYRRLRHLDYAVVVFILIVIAVSGYLVGVGVGLVLMVILFVINSSRLNIFHHTLSGAETKSHVERDAHQRRTLTSLGSHIYILELRGFIFFGTSTTILEQVRKRLEDKDEKPLKFLVLDFRRVGQFDSSAVFSFTKVKLLADAHDFTLLFTSVTEDDQRELVRNGLEAGERLRFFPDLDHALEWCEDTLIKRYEVTKKHVPATLALQLADNGFKKEYTQRLKDYLQKLTLESGDYLIRQGETTTSLFFIEIGSVSVYLELNNDKRIRLSTANMGTVVGELGFYLDKERSASVIANLKTIAYCLDQEKLQQMKTQDPELAIAFNELMVRMVAERLVANNRKLAALNR